jgi:hypothetical protein
LYSLTFYSILLLSNQCKGSQKDFCKSIDHGRIAIKREQQHQHQQELWLHWHVNSLTGLMFSYLLWSVIPPLWSIYKKLPPQFLSVTSSNCRNTSYQIMRSDPMETTTKYCILHRLCLMFPFASEERRI